jgi:hypothetical protein
MMKVCIKVVQEEVKLIFREVVIAYDVIVREGNVVGGS